MIGEVTRDAKPGSLVEVLDKEGKPFGSAFWNPKAGMPLRVFDHGGEVVGEDFFFSAIQRAAELRRSMLKLDAHTEAYRAIHGDADQMPGLVADKFGDVLSLEITNLAAWQRLDSWIPALHEAFGTNRTHVRVDPDLARIEGIPSLSHPLSEKIRPLKIKELGVTFEIDPAGGHKTGFFCDQRDNRKKFADLAADRSVLDLCCYTGGFSVSAALAGATDVTAVDLDEIAIEMAKRNSNLNQQRVKFTHADAFTWARTMIENGRQWDLVIADPPKFIHGREDQLGHNKYHDLNKLALQLVKPGGLFVTCSCSGLLSADEFEKIVISAAHRQNKRLQIFDRTGAGPDHPTLSNYPESRYLKLLWCRVI
ncbi:MAG: class I SAM-dependent rRNA methyltransferase [Verrucomicrobia bacterium]|nr:MAG: class I SAM-dependent rRNA methyltransferase [Verrucomicrobiota bacterium]TAE89057.1 MAG: class I SAM-dependent rRNA methyltransferase [Verrucomicrobiota bacterium]TAF28070.1 MAG: class I SAM-dependent rRNA methyltransferase [Verrucomicrobiota bacterium]TAF42917.1 MAG: class I SAM-dependent rRNA methyltransferase [Verrucomicrobiota bacterium]